MNRKLAPDPYLTVHDWGWPKNGPFWTKNGQTWQACQRSKVVQRGPKGTKMVNLSLFDHLGPRLRPSGPFWTISDKNDFFAPNGQNRVLQRCFGAKYQFLFRSCTHVPGRMSMLAVLTKGSVSETF